MFNIFLFLSFSFIFIFYVGKLLQIFRVPWVFAALLLGGILAIDNSFAWITGSETFVFLAEFGMYFLLFMIGLELNLTEVRRKKFFIFKAAFFIILFEGFVGSFLVHFLFDYSWVVSGLVALSFATVGEAILIPILEEFKMVNTKLGQAIIGIGTADDILELLILISITFFIGYKSGFDILISVLSLVFLFLMTVGFKKLKNRGEKFEFKSVETLFFFVIGVFLLYVGVGELSDATPIAAFLAGISMRTFIPNDRLELIDKEIKAMAYGFFVPIFFIWVGSSVDFSYIGKYPLEILSIVVVSNGVKILGSYIVAKNELGKKGSILLGIGLSVRFSTSIVIIKILMDNGIIGIDLFSVIVASSVIFKFIIPVLFSNLLVKWKIKEIK